MESNHEFRVSFPATSLSSNEAYSKTLKKLMDKCTGQHFSETNTHFVTPPHFGLQLIDEKWLVLRVRSKSLISGIDQWTTYELADGLSKNSC